MWKYLNKGISTPLAIAIILILAITVGGVAWWQYGEIEKEKGALLEIELPEKEEPEMECVVTGCSGQICAEEHIPTTCEFLPYYICYKDAICEVQADGKCGWTETKELVRCLEEHGKDVRIKEPTIEEWIDYSRNMKLAQAREHEGIIYLLATYGVKPTGGYNVEITDIIEKVDQVAVKVKFTEPEKDDAVIQIITRPYDLKQIDFRDVPITFIDAEKDIPVFATLYGLDWLLPIVAEKDNIKLFYPGPWETVSREFRFEGIEKVFEGHGKYRLFEVEEFTGNIIRLIEEGGFGGHGHFWGYFNKKITVPEEIQSGANLQLNVYSESPKDGSGENFVSVKLILE